MIDKIKMAALAVAVAAGLAGCMKYEKPNSDTSTSGTMTMVCDNSFQNIMEQEIEVSSSSILKPMCLHAMPLRISPLTL